MSAERGKDNSTKQAQEDASKIVSPKPKTEGVVKSELERLLSLLGK